MAGKRRRYSDDFQAKVALEAICRQTTIAELVSKKEVHQTLINASKRQRLKACPGVFSGNAAYFHYPP